MSLRSDQCCRDCWGDWRKVSSVESYSFLGGDQWVYWAIPHTTLSLMVTPLFADVLPSCKLGLQVKFTFKLNNKKKEKEKKRKEDSLTLWVFRLLPYEDNHILHQHLPSSSRRRLCVLSVTSPWSGSKAEHIIRISQLLQSVTVQINTALGHSPTQPMSVETRKPKRSMLYANTNEEKENCLNRRRGGGEGG